MKNKSKFMGIAGGLLFLAFVTVNVTVSRSYHGNKSVTQLTLVELAAKALSGEECTSSINCDRINGSSWYMKDLDVNGDVKCCKLAHPSIEGNKEAQ